MNPLIKVKTENLIRLKHFWALGLVLFLFADPRVLAQDESSVTEFEELEGEPIVELEELTVTSLGTRSQARTVVDSPVPVDVIEADVFLNLGETDMDSMLSAIIPSYTVNQQPISDAATLVRPANLRGLPPDSTLILINGKRRHRAAVITFLGAGIADGSQGPDIAVIPAIALDRVEVLYDGASAQYGSDAIAGVINFALKNDTEGGTITTMWGETYEGDGDTYTVAANMGYPLTDAGFANFSVEYKEALPTSRSIQRADAQALIDAGNTAVRTPAAQVWGAPETIYDFKFFANMGLALGNSKVYSFSNWSKRKIEGGFYYRNPNTRSGVFQGPVVDGTPTIRVADLTPDGSGTPPVVKVIDNVPDAAALAEVAAHPDYFAFNERFPGGFTPFFGGTITDASLAAGIRGEWDNNWFYDLSGVAGRSRADFFIRNTINPQLAGQKTNIPIEYVPGSYIETDYVFNLDVSRQFDNRIFHSPVNVALGLEYRGESFKIENGDVNSFYIDPNLAAQGFGIGSNGFAGFRPDDAGENSRSSYGAYIDLEADVVEGLLVGAAARFEDYEDFGSTFNGKVTARKQLAENLAVRGAISSGFRAPTVGQSHVRNVTTGFVDGKLSDKATLQPTNPVSLQKGARALEPETAINITLGTVFNIGEVDINIDYFNIKVEDRISLTGDQILTENDINTLLAAGVSDASSFTAIRFFTNAFDTTTQGIDIGASYSTDRLGGDRTVFNFAANWTDTKVDRFDPSVIDYIRIDRLEQGIPKGRFFLTANHYMGPWRFMGRAQYYGGFLEYHADSAGLVINAESKVLFDAELEYSFSDKLTFVVGAKNIFNTYPTDNPHATVVGSLYPESSPFGINGAFYYFKATWKFR